MASARHGLTRTDAIRLIASNFGHVYLTESCNIYPKSIIQEGITK